MAQQERVIIWKVHCPKDGQQLLRHSAMHVIWRDGMDEHVITYFCPACHEQRYQVVQENVAQALIDQLDVSYSMVEVPLEAMENHWGAPIDEAYIERCLKVMAKEQWAPKLFGSARD